MKKIFVTGFYFILTIAVCAAGFLLPSTMTAYQDRQIFARIEHSPVEPMALTYSSSLLDTLQLLSRYYVPYYVDYPAAGSNRTADEVHQITLDVIRQLEEHDIFLLTNDTIYSHSELLKLAIASDDYNSSMNKTDIATDITNAGSEYPVSTTTETGSEETKVKPAAKQNTDLYSGLPADQDTKQNNIPYADPDISQYADSDAKQDADSNINQKPDSGTRQDTEPDTKQNENLDTKEHTDDAAENITTAVVWLSSIEFQSGYWLNIWIDDKSGKAVAFTMSSEQLLAAVSDRTQLDTFVQAWTSFVQDYYEIPAELLLLTVNEIHSVYDRRPSIFDARYMIHLKDESMRSIQIPFTLRAEYMTLN